MIVYVETNFVLAIALEQEDAEPATAILEYAERGLLELVFPAVAIIEPFSTVIQRGRTRKRFETMLEGQIQDLGRSRPHQAVVALLRQLPVLLAEIVTREDRLLAATVQRLLDVGRTIPMDGPVLEAASVRRDRYGISSPDAIVLASVLLDLVSVPVDFNRCFVNKNKRDFADRGIIAELSALGCTYEESFASAEALIASTQ